MGGVQCSGKASCLLLAIKEFELTTFLCLPFHSIASHLLTEGGWCIYIHQLTFVDNSYSIAKFFRFLNLMGGQQHGYALSRHFSYQIPDTMANLGIQGHCRLIHKQNLWFVNQGSGYQKPSFHAP